SIRLSFVLKVLNQIEAGNRIEVGAERFVLLLLSNSKLNPNVRLHKVGKVVGAGICVPRVCCFRLQKPVGNLFFSKLKRS
ncbi:MAG: hypothetical protein RMM53_06845, partial [Bacteroidia bacterium]|nr:hypothetical protein [Bacteroidia bacterium]MDW8333916.1 hypothetical protein [Bacteroidia bacterium]